MSEKHQDPVQFRTPAPFVVSTPQGKLIKFVVSTPQGKLIKFVVSTPQGKLIKMVYFVYIVKCRNGSYYTGITWNLERRILEHNLGIKTPIQKSRRPVKLVYWENFKNRKEAAKREREIKGWRREKKEKLINSLH